MFYFADRKLNEPILPVGNEFPLLSFLDATDM